MRKLNDRQRNFIKEYFFNLGSSTEIYGWESIAEKLLTTGVSIVAGNERIWSGGVGNFIKVDVAVGYVDCFKYTFDLEYFLSSEYYKEIKRVYLTKVLNKQIEYESEYNSILKI